MEDCRVEMNDSIALIYPKDRECWLIRSSDLDDLEREPAPQMHNAHLSQHFEVFRMEDTHPFPRIRDTFKRKVPLCKLVDAIFFCCRDHGEAIRISWAKLTWDIINGEYGSEALVSLEQVLMRTDIFDDLEFSKPILDTMHPRLFLLLSKAYRKHRGHALPIKHS